MNPEHSILKTFLLISGIWCGLCSMVVAQDGEELQHWSWYASVNYSQMGRGTYSFFIINPTNEYQIQTRTEFRPSFHLGVRYRLNKYFFSTAGLSYNDNGHETRRLVIPGFEESFHTYQAFYVAPNIGIELHTSTFIKNVDFNLANIWMYNLYLGERSTEPEFSSTDLFNWKNYMSTAFSSDLAYRFNNKTSLGVGPKVEINVTKTTKKEDVGDSVNNNFIRIAFQLTLRSNF